MIKILVIDDKIDNLISVKALLRNLLPESMIITALSGSEGISYAIKEEPDVVLLDILMPVMDGYEVCNCLKNNELTRNIPIIMLTAAYTDTKSRIRGLELGADAFLSKPIDEGELIAQIKVMLRIKKAEYQLKILNQQLQKDLNHSNYQLAESENRYRQLFEKNLANLILIDVETGFISDANEAACRFYGYSKEEFLTKHIGDINVLGREKMNLIVKESAMRTKNHFEFQHYLANKEIRFVESFYVPIKINEQLFLYSIIHDITEQKEAELKLQEALMKIEESDRLKTAFLSNISHEIRTPLNVILGFSELIILEEVSKEQREKYKEYIFEANSTLLHLFDDIMEVSQLESGSIKIMEIECNVAKMLEELRGKINEEKFKKDKAHLNVILQIPDDYKNLKILADERRLKQILTNFLSNALKFTHKGFIEFGFSLPNKREITFFVKDTGIGISEENLPHIFDRFRKVNDDSSQIYGGLGLGLTIAKRMIELLHGNISVESTFRQGTKFSFTIPIKYSDEKKVLAEFSHHQWNNKTILIVEDEDFNYFFLQEVLELTKAKILHSKNGKDAVETYLQNRDSIDLILMDMKMPVMDGYESTRRIKEINPNIPIIAQTVFALGSEKKLLFEAGCNDFISKPIRPSLLYRILERYFEKN